MSRQPRRCSSDGYLAEDAQAGPVEITEQTRSSLEAWIADRGLRSSDPSFPNRNHASAPVNSSVRQDRASLDCVIGLDDTAYGTHTMRRTKASLIYRRTKNPRASIVAWPREAGKQFLSSRYIAGSILGCAHRPPQQSFATLQPGMRRSAFSRSKRSKNASGVPW
ncbi:hypothetical protein D3C81_1608380 [compost metagenome]